MEIKFNLNLVPFGATEQNQHRGFTTGHFLSGGDAELFARKFEESAVKIDGYSVAEFQVSSSVLPSWVLQDAGSGNQVIYEIEYRDELKITLDTPSTLDKSRNIKVKNKLETLLRWYIEDSQNRTVKGLMIELEKVNKELSDTKVQFENSRKNARDDRDEFYKEKAEYQKKVNRLENALIRVGDINNAAGPGSRRKLDDVIRVILHDPCEYCGYYACECND